MGADGGQNLKENESPQIATKITTKYKFNTEISKIDSDFENSDVKGVKTANKGGPLGARFVWK